MSDTRGDEVSTLANVETTILLDTDRADSKGPGRLSSVRLALLQGWLEGE